MDYVARFVLIPGCWIVWIVLLGYVDSGCVDLVAGFVFWFSAGGLCGLCCWVCFDSELSDCVDCVAGLC